jgi:large subunit ribosomal protein L17
LFTHERIITTVAKAKELRPIAERMVTLAGTGTLAARRKVATMVQDKEIAQRLFEEIAPRFADRPGGYTRIMRLGRRHGDNAELAIIEFIDYELADHQDGGESGGKGSFIDRAKGMFGGGAAAGESESADEQTTETAAADEEPEAVEADAADDEAVEAEAVTEEAAEAVVEEAAEEVVEAEEAVETAAADESEPAVDEPATESEEATAEPVEDDEKKDA